LQQLCHIGPFQKLIAVLDALMFNNQKAEYFPYCGFTLIISILAGAATPMVTIVHFTPCGIETTYKLIFRCHLSGQSAQIMTI